MFETNATEVMRLDASGNVNLYGTDNRPLAITSFATASAGAGWDLDATSSNGEVTVSTGGTEAMRIGSSQNLLVGVTSTTLTGGSLTLPNSGIIAFHDAGGAARNTLQFVSGELKHGAAGGGLTSQTFFTSATERMRIDSSGNVRIGVAGTTTITGLTQTNLIVGSGTGGEIVAYRDDNGVAANDFVGAFLFGNDDNNTPEDHFAGMWAKSTSTQGNMDIHWSAGRLNYEADTPQMTLDASGNVLVGGTSVGASDSCAIESYGAITIARASGVGRIHMTFTNGGATVGTISTTGSATAYNTSSDQRLKENIADADNAGSKIDAIQVRKFDWKADGSHQDYGMVAQELLEVAPEAVSAPEDPEEMMGVDYSKLVPMMLKEIQSLRARIAALES